MVPWIVTVCKPRPEWVCSFFTLYSPRRQAKDHLKACFQSTNRLKHELGAHTVTNGVLCSGLVSWTRVVRVQAWNASFLSIIFNCTQVHSGARQDVVKNAYWLFCVALVQTPESMQQNMYYQPQPAMMMMPAMGQMGSMMGFAGNQFYQQVDSFDSEHVCKLRLAPSFCRRLPGLSNGLTTTTGIWPGSHVDSFIKCKSGRYKFCRIDINPQFRNMKKTQSGISSEAWNAFFLVSVIRISRTTNPNLEKM